MKIDHVEVRVVAPHVERYTWSHDLPEQYMTNTIVRIRTDDGVEGVAGVSNYTSHAFDRYTAETLRHLVPILIGKNPLQRETLWREMWSRVFPFAPQALAAVDNALWDLMGRVAGLPVYQMLGGARDRIQSYASTPMLEDVPAYLRFIEEMVELGFRAVKFHMWCLPEKDLELARAVRKQYPGDDVQFMFDAENNYDRVGALRVAQELDDLNFRWFEAPLPDFDIEGYCELTSRVSIPVVPSGNWIQDLPAFADALRKRAWRTARTDVTMCGGFTRAQKFLALVEAAGIDCEIMSWGYTLIACSNLHLQLSIPNCQYYEQAVPFAAYEYGMKDVIRTQSDGYVYAPKKPGLGVDVDWPAMESATIHSFTSDD